MPTGDYTPQDEYDEYDARENRINKKRLAENVNYTEKNSGSRSRTPGDAVENLRKSDAAMQDAINRLRVERDATVSAGLPTKYNQQTLVGNISGAGNRHVIEDTQSARRPVNILSQISDFAVPGSITVQTGPFSGGYTGTVDNVTTITLDERYFLIQDNGGGEVLVSLNTTECP